MADIDTITKSYMSDNEHFADLFNYFIFGGEHVIKPDDLTSLDTTSIALPYKENKQSAPVQRFRDILKDGVIKVSDTTVYAVLGLENQTEINNAMVIKNGLYDFLEYSKQVTETGKLHRQNKDKPYDKGEFLSGFYKGDKLKPVITLTLYFGADKWNGARDLHSLLNLDERISKFVDNYHLNLISPAEIEDFENFDTELGAVLKYIKASEDKKSLYELIHTDRVYSDISRESVDLINAVTASKITYNEREERVDMCRAIEGLIQDSRAEGRTEGALEMLSQLVEKGILTLSQAAEQANMSVAEFKKITGVSL